MDKAYLHESGRAELALRPRARRAPRALRATRARGARARQPLRRPRTTYPTSTATRSAWTSRGTCLGRPCLSSSVPLRSSAMLYRTRRCATRASCDCSGRSSGASSRSKASTPPPPPPLPRARPPALRPPPAQLRARPRTTKSAAEDICRSTRSELKNKFKAFMLQTQ